MYCGAPTSKAIRRDLTFLSSAHSRGASKESSSAPSKTKSKKCARITKPFPLSRVTDAGDGKLPSAGQAALQYPCHATVGKLRVERAPSARPYRSFRTAPCFGSLRVRLGSLQESLSIMPEVSAGASNWIRFVPQQPLPDDPVELLCRDPVFFTEIEAFGPCFPPGRVVGRLRDRGQIHFDARVSKWQLCVEQDQCGRSMESPFLLVGVESVGHGRNPGIMHAEIFESEDLLDRAQHIRRGIVSGHHRAMLHVGSDNESSAAVGADVIGAVLRVIFDNEDQCAIGIGTVGNFVDQQSRSVVVVGHLQFRRVYNVDRCAKAAEVVMRKPDQRESREFMSFDLVIKFTSPLLVAEKIWEGVVVTTETEVRSGDQRRVRGKGNLRRGLGGARVGDFDINLEAPAQVEEEPVIADVQMRANGGIPNIAETLLALRTVGRHFIGRARQ